MQSNYNAINELLESNDFWEEVIEDGVSKGLEFRLLSLLTVPEGRQVYINMIMNKQRHIEPPRVVQIPKDDGKIREIYMNEDIDRVLLTVIYKIYYRLYSHYFHENCVSYKVNVGVHKVVDKVCQELKNGMTGYKVDLTKFFDTVPRSILNESLKELSSNHPVDEILFDYYNDDRVKMKHGDVERYKSLCQGCAMGCFLANYVLRDIDEKLSNLNIIYYRYSDDLLMIGKDSEKALVMLKEMLSEKELTLNPKKVEKLENEKPFTFLGAKIYKCSHDKNEVSISKKSLKSFQKEIERITINKIGSMDKKNMRLKQMNKVQIKKAIKEINYYLYTNFMKSSENYGWAEYKFKLITMQNVIAEMDMFIKDCLRASYTGKTNVGGLGSVNTSKGVQRGKGRNVAANMVKTTGAEFEQNDLLKELGYVSMNHLWKCYRNPELFRAELRRLMS